MSSAAQRRVEKYQAYGVEAGSMPGAILVDPSKMKWTPFPSGGAEFVLLNVDVTTGGWTGIVRFPADTALAMHLHLGGVEAYTISGAWSYQEGDLRDGCYMYEPSGILHEPEMETEVVMLIVSHGANVYFDEEGNVTRWTDAHMLYTLVKQNGAAEHLKHLDGLLVERTVKPAVFD